MFRVTGVVSVRVFFFLCRQRFTMASSLALLLTLSGCTNTTHQQGKGSATISQTISSQSDLTQNKNIGSSTQKTRLPLRQQLTEWLKLASAPYIRAQEYADFLDENPHWPRHRFFVKRMEQALATETNPTVLNTLCRTKTLTNARALAQCFRFFAFDTAISTRLQSEAAHAWITSNDTPAAAVALIKTFPTVITPLASWQRFVREERTGKLEAARRTLPYLSTDRQALAKTILAFHLGDSSAVVLNDALPASLRKNPILILNEAQWLRKTQQYDAALSLWKSTGIKAEQRAKNYADSFWHERSVLAYKLLYNAYAPADIFTIANDTIVTGRHRFDAQFLSGWIALRKLHDPSTAQAFFQSLTSSPALLTRSRGFYWLGRAFSQQGNNKEAYNAWQNAAAFPSTFYGQMAAACLDGDHRVLLTPPYISSSIPQRLYQALAKQPSASDTSALDHDDIAQAAILLVEMGDLPHARVFLTFLLQQNHSLKNLAALSSFADKLGLQDIAISAARFARKNGVLLLRTGWPMPYQPPRSPLPRGFVLGLIRQESSFNPIVMSTSHAIGLMQLKPSTAADMLRVTGLPAFSATARGLRNPTNNMQLGTAYLLHISKSFGPVIPYITAAYNAGPGRVKQWLNTIGNPIAQENASDNDMIDWIESIPFAETRNYVQRVWENMTIYAVLDNKNK